MGRGLMGGGTSGLSHVPRLASYFILSMVYLVYGL